MIPFLIYVAIFVGSFWAVRLVAERSMKRSDYTSLKTVTFGDESAVISNRYASVISLVTIFFLWGTFTGSILLPKFMHMPSSYVGDGTFDYVVEGPGGARDGATMLWRVAVSGQDTPKPEIEEGDGFARNDTVMFPEKRSGLVLWDRNDDVSRKTGAKIVEINGQVVTFDTSKKGTAGNLTQEIPVIEIENGTVTFTDKGALSITPSPGLQMEPIWLPPPEHVWGRLIEIASQGYKGFTLQEHLGYSLFRVIAGFVLGAIVGIPLGYAMGLSGWFRGWFDPIVEFMRPVPPLALIPLVIIWLGIGEKGKIVLLFLAALWIMAIAARSGVSGVRISKVHAAYSLGASKAQVMRYVIMPNSLPEIFTGARVAMGVCWGTVVAAELVAASQGAGMMIMTARNFQQTDIVIMGIILIGVIGYGIDILMRMGEKWLVPWKGKG